MRVPEPTAARLRRSVTAFVVLALASVAAAQADAPAPAAPVAPLAAFDRFELVDVELDSALRGPDVNEHARRELQMFLHDRLDPWVAERNRIPARGTPPRTLRIEPTIVALAYIDPAVRIAVGPVAGTERLHVRVRFVDAATGDAIAATELRADGSMLMNVSSLGATAQALPRRIAEELAETLEAGLAATATPESRLPH
jgi:hypothetical protein